MRNSEDMYIFGCASECGGVIKACELGGGWQNEIVPIKTEECFKIKELWNDFWVEVVAGKWEALAIRKLLMKLDVGLDCGVEQPARRRMIWSTPDIWTKVGEGSWLNGNVRA